MDNTSFEINSARAILSTYQQINDTPNTQKIVRPNLHKRNKELIHELHQLKEKYLVLQNELTNRDKKLANLNKELMDKASYASQLQDDFENAIYQLANKKDQVDI